MKTDKSENWLYTIPQKWNLLGVGKTREDAIAAFDAAKDSGDLQTKTLGTEVGPAVSLVERWVVKTQEVISKTLGTLLPLVGGMKFLLEAADLFSGPEISRNPAMGSVMGIIGLAAISIGPVVAWRFGQAYHEIHRWMKDNGDLKRAHIVTPAWGR